MNLPVILAYAGYVAWLLAGNADFRCHRKTDLPGTSGLRETRLHVLQMGLMGALVASWLLLAPGLGVFAAQAVLVAAHAVVGYFDTRSAFGVRTLSPVEQHLHSVLDMAPWIALAVVVHDGWPQALRRGWGLFVREPALPVSVWAAVLLPAMLLCGVPLLREWRAALAVRGTG